MAGTPDPQAERRKTLRHYVTTKKRHFEKGQKRWSLAYHAPLYTAPVTAFATTLSAAGGHSKTLSTVGGAVTTLLTALSAQGRFQDKWRANRLARSQLEQLSIALSDPAVDLARVETSLQQIIKEEDLGILGPADPH